MKRTAIILSAVAILFARGQVIGQDEEGEPNVHHEKLKVLEPLIGSWHAEGERSNRGIKWESITSASWSDAQKMIQVQTKYRTAELDGDLAAQEWKEWGQMQFYVWNSDANRIEFYVVNRNEGEVYISQVDCGKDGVITYPRIRATAKGGFNGGQRTDKVTKQEWTSRFFGAKDQEGNESEGWELTRQKIEN
jgi:hypothetical protein